MPSVIQIAEIAVLLAIAYMAGWTIGYVVRRLTAGSAKPVELAIPADRLAAAKGESEALVKAPVIAPLPVEPVRPQIAEPTPAVAVETAPPLAPVTVVEAVPAPVAEAPIPPAPIVVPVEPASPPPPQSIEVPPLPPISQPMPIAPVVNSPPPAPIPHIEPTLAPEPVVAFTAMPAAKPGQAWVGEIRGRASTRPVVDTPLAEPVPDSAPPVAEVLPVAEPVPEPPAAVVAAAIAPEPIVAPPPQPIVAAPLPPPEPPPTPEPVAPPPPKRPVAPPHDEDAAMRAIEGGWSRVRARAMPNAPELSDVGAAVAAAQTAVEQVLAQAGIDPVTTANANKPVGLVRPRGPRDDLKRIEGVSELDEMTLNNLGVFHFHQIAAWDETEVLWMENHVFARGRLGRENWQQQARDLATAIAG